MRGTRAEVGLAVLLCLVGACLVLGAAGRPWAEVGVTGNGLLPARTIGVDGTELVTGLRALGLVGLAGVVAVAATRRWGRVLVGLVLLVVGTGTVALVVDVLRDVTGAALGSAAIREAGGGQSETVDGTLAPFAVALGGLLLAAAGGLVAGRGRRWAVLSQRYESPAARAEAAMAQGGQETGGPIEGPVAERELWEALDRGEDPTAR